MKGPRERIEAWFSAVAFAEAEDHETALKMVGRKPGHEKHPSLDSVMAAITFAEAGLHDTAREFLRVERPAYHPARLGLPAGKVCYGTAAAHREAISLQLPGVKIWYGVAPV